MFATVSAGQSGFKPRCRMPKPTNLRTICGSLVSLSPEPGNAPIDPDQIIVHLAHASVQDFLSSDQLPSRIVSCLEERQAKLDLISLSLGYQSSVAPLISNEDIQMALDDDLSGRDPFKLGFNAKFPLLQLIHDWWLSFVQELEPLERPLLDKLIQYLRNGGLRLEWPMVGPDGWVYVYSVEEPEDVLQGTLYWASAANLPTVVQQLLSIGADLNEPASECAYQYALQIAVARHYQSLVELMIDQGADVNQAGHYWAVQADVTPIWSTATEGDEAIAQILLDAGADPTVGNSEAGWPLVQAITRGHVETARVFIRSDWEVQQSIGLPADSLQEDMSLEDMWEVLLAHRMTPKIDNCLLLIERKSARTNELLESCLTADLVAQKYWFDSRTIIHWAVLNDAPNLVAASLKLGADINTIDRWGDSALHHAAAEGDLEMVKTLIAAGSDLRLKNRLGFTPAEVAADDHQQADPEVAAYLQAEEETRKQQLVVR